jgi:hypothetical protein
MNWSSIGLPSERHCMISNMVFSTSVITASLYKQSKTFQVAKEETKNDYLG